MGNCVQHNGPRGGEAGAPCEEVLGCLISCFTGAHGGRTVYKTMVMPVIPKIATVNANFSKGLMPNLSRIPK